MTFTQPLVNTTKTLTCHRTGRLPEFSFYSIEQYGCTNIKQENVSGVCLWVDYLTQVRSSCDVTSLDELMKKFEVLQYLSQKRPEPDPKLLELQDQMSTWMNSNMNPNTRVSEIHSCLNCLETLFSMIKPSGISYTCTVIAFVNTAAEKSKTPFHRPFLAF